MSGGLPLGTFARQRRDFNHENCVWQSGPFAGVANEVTIQLWNDSARGWALQVYAFRLVSDSPASFNTQFIQEQIDPGFGSRGVPVRGDQPARYGIVQGQLDTPITIPNGVQFDSTPQGVIWYSEAPLFVIPAGYGLCFDFFGGAVYGSVTLLWAASIDTSPGRTDLS